MIFNHLQVCEYDEMKGENFPFLQISPSSILDSVIPIDAEIGQPLSQENTDPGVFLNLGIQLDNAPNTFEDFTFSDLMQPRQAPSKLNETTENDVSSTEIYLRRGKFTPEEDARLKALVAEHGRNWALIAKLMQDKERKQVRERYENFLGKKLNRKPFSIEDDCKILDLIGKMGTKFYKIAEQFEGRSATMIKNRYYSKLMKQKTSH